MSSRSEIRAIGFIPIELKIPSCAQAKHCLEPAAAVSPVPVTTPSDKLKLVEAAVVFNLSRRMNLKPKKVLSSP